MEFSQSVFGFPFVVFFSGVLQKKKQSLLCFLCIYRVLGIGVYKKLMMAFIKLQCIIIEIEY